MTFKNFKSMILLQTKINLSNEDLLSLLNEDNQKEINSKNKFIAINIDYNKSVSEMISLGKYDFVNPFFRKIIFYYFNNSMNINKQTIIAKLFFFNSFIKSNEAIKKIDKVAFRPATLFELLTLGYLYPNLQNQFPIVALGTTIKNNGMKFVPALISINKNKRILALFWNECEWFSSFRFLGVSK